MSSTNLMSLSDQRLAIRAQLRAQRAVIAQQLSPELAIQSGYPRSKTMRFLNQHSKLAGGVVAGATTLLVGANYLKPIAAALTMFNLFRSATDRK